MCGEKLKILCYLYHNKWITPACAGKSALSENAAMRDEDHPRVCGEKRKDAAYTNAEIGSPPRVRGKAYTTAQLYIPYRITPACAGKSKQILEATDVDKDHPRVCGEKQA